MITPSLPTFIMEMPVTLILMLVVLVTSCAAFVQPAILFKLLLHPVSVWRGQELYRLLSADLVHNDILHLLVNEFLLFAVGGTLEKYLRKTTSMGSWQYGAVYLSSIFFGSVTVTLLNRNDFKYSTAGASGSLMGCLFCYMMLQPREPGFYLPLWGPVNNLFSGLIVISGIIVYQFRSKNPLVNHEIHFFGALGGMVATLVFFHR